LVISWSIAEKDIPGKAFRFLGVSVIDGTEYSKVAEDWVAPFYLNNEYF
jgi:hypothetical protein